LHKVDAKVVRFAEINVDAKIVMYLILNNKYDILTLKSSERETRPRNTPPPKAAESCQNSSDLPRP
jgi:hypothetical protein